MSIELSVCICTYNTGQRVHRVIGALAAQAGIDPTCWELIVVDNNSSDGTYEAVQSIAAEFPARLTVLLEKEPGQMYARRTGLKHATGKLFAYIDDDNVVEPEWLKTCLAFFKSHERAGVAGGRVLGECAGPQPEEWDLVKWMLSVRDDWGEKDLCLSEIGGDRIVPGGAGLAFRRQVLEEVFNAFPSYMTGRVPGVLSCGDDIEIGVRVIGLGWESWYVAGLTLTHLLPADRLTDEYLFQLKAGQAACTPAIASILETGDYPPRVLWALKRLYWGLLPVVASVPVFFRRDFRSRLRAAGLKGRLAGTWRQLADAVTGRRGTISLAPKKRLTGAR